MDDFLREVGNEHPERFFPATQIDVVWFPEGSGGDRFDEKTFAEVASKIGKSLRAVERPSSKLVKACRLRFVGPKKGGHWEVKEKS